MRFQDYMRNKNWSHLSRPSTNDTTKSPLSMIEDGLFYFVAGLSLKVLLADHLSMIPHQAQAIGFSSISTTLAWICAYAYSLQIYFDFWGYSLMASGIAVMLGFPFIQNFDHPYAATSVTSFYRKRSRSGIFSSFGFSPRSGTALPFISFFGGSRFAS